MLEKNNPTQVKHSVLGTYLLHHFQACSASLSSLIRTPLSTLMTVLVIGVTLTLPLLLWMMLENLEQVTQSWSSKTQISLFLKKEVKEEGAKNLMKKIMAEGDIEKVNNRAQSYIGNLCLT